VDGTVEIRSAKAGPIVRAGRQRLGEGIEFLWLLFILVKTDALGEELRFAGRRPAPVKHRSVLAAEPVHADQVAGDPSDERNAKQAQPLPGGRRAARGDEPRYHRGNNDGRCVVQHRWGKHRRIAQNDLRDDAACDRRGEHRQPLLEGQAAVNQPPNAKQQEQ
jgi:hypothetical protein